MDTKLTIELVPRSTFNSNVRSMVTRTQWDKIRKTVYERAGHKCEICNGKGTRHPVECHEIWTFDEENKIQKLTGLIALCPSCHRVKHIGLAKVKGYYPAALNHLCKINCWTKQHAEGYINECFELWNKRSEVLWHVDITMLDNLIKKV